jgi:hypothetical protein
LRSNIALDSTEALTLSVKNRDSHRRSKHPGLNHHNNDDNVLFDFLPDVMNLALLFLGVDMLVDNSSCHEPAEGAQLTPAALLGLEGTKAVVVASTSTITYVFLPLVTFQGRLEMAGSRSSWYLR